jgi:hypothetical protein
MNALGVNGGAVMNEAGAGNPGTLGKPVVLRRAR